MLFGGLQKMTLIDYPDKVAATVFTLGCNFHCHFCHNPGLVILTDKIKAKAMSETEVLGILKSRKKLIEAVCITGGEPTLWQDLPKFIAQVKDLGLLVKLDTNGSNPTLLKSLITKKLVDYIAMDIKAPWRKYSEVVDKKINLEKIERSVIIIRESGLPYEFRTTVLPRLHSRADILEIAKNLKGSRAFFLQQFRPQDNLVNPEFVPEKKYTLKELEEIRSEIKGWFEICKVR